MGSVLEGCRLGRQTSHMQMGYNVMGAVTGVPGLWR